MTLQLDDFNVCKTTDHRLVGGEEEEEEEEMSCKAGATNVERLSLSRKQCS